MKGIWACTFSIIAAILISAGVGCSSVDQASNDLHNAVGSIQSTTAAITSTANAATTVVNDAATIINAVMNNPVISALLTRDETPGNRAVVFAAEHRRKDAEKAIELLVTVEGYKTSEIRAAIGKDATDDYESRLQLWMGSARKGSKTVYLRFTH